MTEFRMAWVDVDAARYACEHWHYSRSLPGAKLVKIGAWEDGAFIGVVIYSCGATPKIGDPFGMDQTRVCELTRIAMRAHATPVSRMIAISLRMLRKHSPDMRVVVSFADMEQDHHGGVYQAAGWTYLGQTGEQRYFRVRGRTMHPKSVHSMGWRQSVPWLRAFVDPAADVVMVSGKHKYAVGLDDEARALLASMSKPYPKRERGVDGDAPGDQPGEGGSIPTRSLHTRR